MTKKIQFSNRDIVFFLAIQTSSHGLDFEYSFTKPDILLIINTFLLTFRTMKFDLSLSIGSGNIKETFCRVT